MSEPRLAVIATVVASYWTAFAGLRSGLPAMLWFPVGLSLLILLAGFAAQELISTWSRWQIWVFSYGSSLLRLVPYTLFAVAWHRAILLDERPTGPAWSWRREHWVFLCYAALFFVLLLLALHIASLIFNAPPDGTSERSLILVPLLMFASWAVPFLIAGVWLRTSLVYPAAAIDRPISLRESWRHTSGQGLRLLVGYGVAVVPLLLIDYLTQTLLFVALFDAFTSDTSGDIAVVSNRVAYVVEVLRLLIGYGFVIVSVTFVSLCYRRLVLDEAA